MMGDHIFGIFDMAIAGGAVLAFCVWQMISINREIAKDRKPKDPPEG